MRARGFLAHPARDRAGTHRLGTADWLPAPFFAGPALRAGLLRVVAALRPGGWLIVGHGKFGGAPAEDALARLKTLAYGGTPIDDAAACQLLHKAGLASVRTVPTPAGAPAITIGQNPACRRAGGESFGRA